MATTSTDVTDLTDLTRVRLAARAIPLVLLAAACGGSNGLDLSPEADNGRKIANSRGCASCHGSDGSGGVGPAFTGLYGSEVTLEDGSKVVADDEYLRRSITDPGAQRVDGYAVSMPTSDLSDDDIEAVLAYIRELGATP
ncbi:MAG: c-type cytochrome [Ilumatobacteraceae bacterium]